jgi:tRNA-specific 2-thiouridylase
VAEDLGFPFYVLNLEREFERDVVEPFVASYLNGETPIPCVSCNSRLKFAALDQLALSLGCEKVATGHYARVDYDPLSKRHRLLRGLNQQKDQSYFLWELTQDQLSRSLFPLGEMSKPEVRDTARRNRLAIAEKEESQEICFVPDGNYSGFIDRYLNIGHKSPIGPISGKTLEAPDQGEIIDKNGTVIGRHTGVHRYTVGQRRGIGIANERPLYVLSIDAPSKRVVVGSSEELLSREFKAAGVNWISGADPAEPIQANVRVRYRHTEAPATITSLGDRRARVVFEEPQRAITPGQAAVFYNGDEVLGGGWIVKDRKQEAGAGSRRQEQEADGSRRAPDE